MANCFVYGTLMAEEVLKCLIKRVPEQRPGKGAAIEGRRKEERAQLDAPQCPSLATALDLNLNNNSSNHRLPQARAQEAGLPGDGARDREGLCRRQGKDKKEAGERKQRRGCVFSSSFHGFFISHLFSFCHSHPLFSQVLSGLTEDEMMVFDGK